jgi:uncharacterized membrane protein YkvA (DUF1232 family)
MASFSKEKAKEEFNKSRKNFSKDNLENLMQKEDSLFSKFLNFDKLNEYYQDFIDLFSLVKDWYKGRYKDVPWMVISSAGGALLYVLSPIDLIPYFIPVIGYLDDAAVFAACLKFIRKDLDKYREWKHLDQTTEAV